MITNLKYFTLLIFSVLFVISCGDSSVTSGNDSEPTIDVPGEISFSASVQPIFTNNCASCHIGNTTSGVNLTDFESIMSSVGDQYGTQVVLPGNADDSPIIDKISSGSPQFGDRMPRGRSPLSSTQIGIIREWIDEGAQDN